jgi:hypothetical protein
MEEAKMIIKCIFSMPSKSIRDYSRQALELAPLPAYITIRGPYINDSVGAGNQAITLYEFDESRFAEAWKSIFGQLDAFHGVPGFTFAAEVLSKEKEVKTNIAFA